MRGREPVATSSPKGRPGGSPDVPAVGVISLARRIILAWEALIVKV